LIEGDSAPEIAFSSNTGSTPEWNATGVPGGVDLQRQAPPEMPPGKVPVQPAAPPGKPIPVGGDVQRAKLLRQPLPVYPPLARQARVSGTVRLLGVISREGTIQKLQVVSGHPLLVPAAIEAVRQWLYQPTLWNGQPVEVIAPIDVNFRLSN
jgi:protein TonB